MSKPVRVTVDLRPDVVHAIEAYAAFHELTRTETIHRAIELLQATHIYEQAGWKTLIERDGQYQRLVWPAKE